MKNLNKSENRPARVVAIHDLSGFGRCSLSVILPILSVMGAQVCPVPTAALSSHTGGLGDVAMLDLTDFILPCLNHYKSLNIDFECIYSGFLSSQKQIDCCLEFYSSYPDALAVVDPVMGDHGKPYRTCTPEIRNRMKELVRVADVITPNLTEAAILLGEEYSRRPLTREQAKSMLLRLSEKGPSQVVVTGCELASGEMANIGYDRDHGSFWYVSCDYVPVSYPGTGDIFASTLTGGLLCGDSLPIAMNRAAKFVEIAVKTTFSCGSDTRYGVMLESALPYLLQRDILNSFNIL